MQNNMLCVVFNKFNYVILILVRSKTKCKLCQLYTLSMMQLHDINNYNKRSYSCVEHFIKLYWTFLIFKIIEWSGIVKVKNEVDSLSSTHQRFLPCTHLKLKSLLIFHKQRCKFKNTLYRLDGCVYYFLYISRLIVIVFQPKFIAPNL